MHSQPNVPADPVRPGCPHRRRQWDIEKVARTLDRMSLEEMAALKEYLTSQRRVRPFWRLRLGSRWLAGLRRRERHGPEISALTVFAP